MTLGLDIWNQLGWLCDFKSGTIIRSKPSALIYDQIEKLMMFMTELMAPLIKLKLLSAKHNHVAGHESTHLAAAPQLKLSLSDKESLSLIELTNSLWGRWKNNGFPLKRKQWWRMNPGVRPHAPLNTNCFVFFYFHLRANCCYANKLHHSKETQKEL